MGQKYENGWGSPQLVLSVCKCFTLGPHPLIHFHSTFTGQWIESVTDGAIRITDWGIFPDWVSSHARLADPIRPMPNKGKSGHSDLPIALIS